MASYIVDTNILVRFLTDDRGEQLAEIKTLFSQAEKGEHSLTITPLIVAETVYVLRSVYQKTPKEISDSLQIMLSQRWIKVEERQILLATLALTAAGTHFVDAYLAIRAKNDATEVFTFDRKLKRLAAGK
ncbi:MAG: PIN domain-containing protein [Candidatus Uhrbacteria bacterium]